jgi:hypothetical protein
MVADVVLFNSCFNMQSFLDSISSFFHTMPDFRPKGLAEKIKPKCEVLYFPIEFPDRSAYRTDHSHRNAELLDCLSDTKMEADLGSKAQNDGNDPSCTDRVVAEISRKRHHVCSNLNIESQHEQRMTSVNDTMKTSDRADDITQSLSVDSRGSQPADSSENVCDRTASTVSCMDLLHSRELLPDSSKALHIIWPHRWYI